MEKIIVKVVNTIRVFFVLTFIPMILLSAGLMGSGIDMWNGTRFLIGFGVLVVIAIEFGFCLVTNNIE